MAWSAIRKRLYLNESEVQVSLRVPRSRAGSEQLDVDLKAAIRAANAAYDDEQGDGEHRAWAPEGAVGQLAAGPVLSLERIGSEEEAHGWLQLLAAQLSEAGWSGKLTVAPITWPPSESGALWSHPRTTAFLAFTQPGATYAGPPYGWQVPAPVTDRLLEELVEWGSFEGADTYVTAAGFSVKLAQPDGRWQMRPLLGGYGVSFYVDPACTRYSEIAAGDQGHAVFLAYRPDADWLANTQHARQALLHQPTKLDLGFLRRNSIHCETWFYVGQSAWGYPYPDEYQGMWFARNRALWNRYTPDAHGIQVLTAAHLDKATNLTDWKVENLGENRYLVEAQDLQPWFSNVPPDPEVLARARLDFGSMIFGFDTVRDEPEANLPNPAP